MTSKHTVSNLVIYGTYVNGRHYRKVDQEGSNTPYALRKAGVFNENPYIGTKVLDIDPVTLVGSSLGNRNQYWPMSSLGGRPSGYPPSVVYYSPIDCLEKLEAKWKGSKFNVGVTVGEGRESAQMMWNRLGGIYRSVRSLKRGNIGGCLRELTGQVPKRKRDRARNRMDEHDISGAWLELQLGWKPMIGDIFEAAKLIKLKARKNRFSVSRAWKGTPMVNGDQTQWKVDGMCEKRTSVIVDVTRNPTWIEAMGLNDPAAIAWELVPFSFVVDWFVPVGNYLGNLHAVGALPAKKVIITRSEKIHGRAVPIKNPTGGLYHGYDMPRNAYKGSRVERDIYSSMAAAFTATDFMPTSITAKWDPDLWKISTAVSLVHHALRDIDGPLNGPIERILNKRF